MYHFMTIWSFYTHWYIYFWSFDKFYGHLEYYFLIFGMLYEEKSGNPASDSLRVTGKTEKTQNVALDIASASGTEDPGSNPARV
jgi:hypothetical protein